MAGGFFPNRRGISVSAIIDKSVPVFPQIISLSV